MTQPTSPSPNFKNTLIWIAIIIVAAWLLGNILHFAADLLNLVLIVAAVLLILWLIQNYVLRHKK